MYKLSTKNICYFVFLSKNYFNKGLHSMVTCHLSARYESVYAYIHMYIYTNKTIDTLFTTRSSIFVALGKMKNPFLDFVLY